MLKNFITWAECNGWKVDESSEKADIPEEVKQRYDIPEQWYNFICRLVVCENSAQTKWFLTPKDYMPHEDGFQWNEFELQSLDLCDSDPKIIAYWSKHFPIFMSVDG